MTKLQARNYFTNLRKKLSEDEINEKSEKIFNQWLVSGLNYFQSFHIFLSIIEKKEINTSFFLQYLWLNNKNVYCSKTKKNQLEHFKLTSDTSLKISKWGIPEPYNENPINLNTIDCVFIPLLAYDTSGNRIGYGKGYYDKFLSSHPNATKIGLSFFNPVSKIEDLEVTDIPLDYIITPEFYSAFPIEEK
ncbi:5-formyltetrahydrofolate cyclo-ligase [Apibacter sp. HY039]|uniref:5-formyltetrahydrofolate cyclo-ligase n=1 Tax=Apibacter sp. HY039 TaxID=2501476 RepID=UPI000FEBB674|nr:5-formyltetrahydrofolate cyclo-ligase [Apibacter sp. HY039]